MDQRARWIQSHLYVQHEGQGGEAVNQRRI